MSQYWNLLLHIVASYFAINIFNVCIYIYIFTYINKITSAGSTLIRGRVSISESEKVATTVNYFTRCMHTQLFGNQIVFFQTFNRLKYVKWH